METFAAGWRLALRQDELDIDQFTDQVDDQAFSDRLLDEIASDQERFARSRPRLSQLFSVKSQASLLLECDKGFDEPKEEA